MIERVQNGGGSDMDSWFRERERKKRKKRVGHRMKYVCMH